MCRNFCKFKNEHLVFCVIQRTEQSEAELKLAYYTENYLEKYRKNFTHSTTKTKTCNFIISKKKYNQVALNKITFGSKYKINKN